MMKFIPVIIAFIVGTVLGSGLQAYCDTRVINSLKDINLKVVDRWEQSNKRLKAECNKLLKSQEKQIVAYYERQLELQEKQIINHYEKRR